MNSAARRITEHFNGDWHGSYGTFPTPGHSQDDRGMSVKDGDAGDVVINSFNGGDWREVKDECRRAGLLPKFEPEKAEWRLAGAWDYVDEDGVVLSREIRLECPGKAKQYRPQRPDGQGGWLNSVKGIRRVLYRLPEILAARVNQHIFLTEGARKAAKLEDWGLLSTACMFGAQGWRSEYAACLAGRTVIILPDNDPDGSGFAERAQADIARAGGNAYILQIPDLPPKGDVIDWNGNREDLLALVDAAIEGSAGPNCEPVDLWARYEEPPLPTGLLPELIERFAVQMGSIMGADAAGLAMAALTVCAAATPDRIVVQVKQHDPTWRESARLWTALVGPPSRKKTPILKAAIAPLRALDNNLMRVYLEQLSEYESRAPADRKGARRPQQRRHIISDATIEAAQEVLRDSPDGVLSEQDELSGWFGAMDKYAPGKGAQADRAFWLKAFNGGTYNLNRVGRGASQIPNLSISLLGGIQPEPIRKLGGEMVDDGLIQRFVPVILRPADVGHDRPVGDVVFEYERLIGRLSLMKPSPRTGIKSLESFAQTQPVHFSPGAKVIRERLEIEHLGLVTALETVSPKLSAHFGKYDGLFARLCLLWTCIEHSEATMPPAEISEDVARRVAKFMEDFIRPSAVTFYAGLLGMSAGHEDLIALAALIVGKGLEDVKARDAQRSTQSFRSMTADDFRTLCEKLEAFGWVQKAEPGPKSSTPRWMVNPRVHTMFFERAAEERSRRSAAREALKSALGG